MNASDLPRPDEPPVHGEVILTHLARARVELEDLATDDSPGDAMLRIGDDTASVRLVGDVATLHRLLAKATHEITALRSERQDPRA
jgi:hypothetical protein